MEPIAIMTTVGSEDEARILGRGVVERNLAASVQISAIESIYHWKGAIREAREFRLAIITSKDLYDQVEQEILKQNSYELPEVYSVAFDSAYPPYVEWIKAHTGKPVG